MGAIGEANFGPRPPVSTYRGIVSAAKMMQLRLSQRPPDRRLAAFAVLAALWDQASLA
jgi:hypothetical protein